MGKIVLMNSISCTILSNLDLTEGVNQFPGILTLLAISFFAKFVFSISSMI